MDLEEPTPRRRARAANAVSFQDTEQRMDLEYKANLQGELEVLERMLWELETETERLSWQQTPQKMKIQGKSPRAETKEKGEEMESQNVKEGGEEAQNIEYEQQAEQEEERLEVQDEDEGEEEALDAEARLGDVCFKSLEIGLELARKMEMVGACRDEVQRWKKD
ncbi:unnamed protein product [Phytophthora lilii]|uniref:Unnamed protein product n=1 Tax=Phytophthora lilii TaxID=2077276 RepID=A0A9W6TME8_9STRA|nr:unnamed protein product [Phytophthora lilii]